MNKNKIANQIADKVNQNGQEEVSTVLLWIEQPKKSKVVKYNADRGSCLNCEGKGQRQDFQIEAINNTGVLSSLWRFDPIACNELTLQGLAITPKDAHHSR